MSNEADSSPAMFATFYVVDLYFTIVKEFDSGDAGVSLIFYTPGLGGECASTCLHTSLDT